MGGLQNNLGSKNRTRRLNARVNTVRLGARTLEKKTIIIKIFSPPPKKTVEPVCPMDDVRLLVWSHWRAGQLDLPLPPVDQVASSKGSRCCWCCRRPAGPGSPVGADVVGADGPGSPSCCGLGRPRWLTRRYPPYPEKEQILLTTLIMIFAAVKIDSWLSCPPFREMMQLCDTFPFLTKICHFAEDGVKMPSRCTHCQHWYSSFGSYFCSKFKCESLQAVAYIKAYLNI